MCNKCRKYITEKTGKPFDANEWEANDYTLEDAQKCLCGKSIHNLFELSSNKHDMKLVVGNVCISNTFTDNKEMIKKVEYVKCDVCDKELKRSSYKAHLKSKKHLMNLKAPESDSDSESEFEIESDEEEYSNIDMDYDSEDELESEDEEDELDNRLCIDCNCDIFDLPNYYTRCKSCYKKKIKNDYKDKPKKKCACGRSISANYNKCYPCFRKF
jgi:hypothetical protein